VITMFLLCSPKLNKGSSIPIDKEKSMATYERLVAKEQLNLSNKDTEMVKALKIALKGKTHLFNDSVTNRLNRIASTHGIKPSWIVYVMVKESGADPTKQNEISNATGIIQFMPSTARALGTSTKELLSMNIYEQLHYVDKYLSAIGKSHLIRSYEDLYLAIFWPRALGKSPDYVISSKKSLVSKQNPTISGERRDGSITVKSFKKYALKL